MKLPPEPIEPVPTHLSGEVRDAAADMAAGYTPETAPLDVLARMMHDAASAKPGQFTAEHVNALTKRIEGLSMPELHAVNGYLMTMTPMPEPLRVVTEAPVNEDGLSPFDPRVDHLFKPVNPTKPVPPIEQAPVRGDVDSFSIPLDLEGEVRVDVVEGSEGVVRVSVEKDTEPVAEPTTNGDPVPALRAFVEVIRRKRPVDSNILTATISRACELLRSHQAFVRHVRGCSKCQRYEWCEEGRKLWQELPE